LWVINLGSSARVQVRSGGINRFPVWAPDGSRVIYWHRDSTTTDTGVAVESVAADGSNAVTLWPRNFQPYSVTRGGVIIARQPNRFAGETIPGAPGTTNARVGGAAAPRGTAPPGARGRGFSQLWLLRAAPDGRSAAGGPETFLDDRFQRQNAAFSPDDKWVAFSSTQNGPREVFVAPFPGPGEIVPISSGGGDEPHWNSNGRELFYRSGDKIMAVDLMTTGPTVRVTAPPRVLFEKPTAGWDVAPGGQRFLMLKPVSEGPGLGDLHVIFNWFDELRRRAPLPE
jgi:hypothetical protein